MKLIQFNKKNFQGHCTTNRSNYTILECSWEDFTLEEYNNILSEAQILSETSNDKQANTGDTRTAEKHYIDSLSGIIAEFAVLKFFNTYNFQYKATRPIVTSSKDQIDISLNSFQKTLSVEVRSSFVRNGISFALFAANKYTNKSYFDIIGTYKQPSYKHDYECEKDLFMRVLFDLKGEDSNIFFNDKEHFVKKYIDNKNKFYIIGGMSGLEIKQQNYSKKLNSNDISNSRLIAGEYNVSEIYHVHDINDFITNNFLTRL